MTELIATYESDGVVHRIELVTTIDGALLLDRGIDGDALVVAELDRGEGRAQAVAVLHSGGYLVRASRGEPRLACPLAEWVVARRLELQRAA